MGKLQKQAAFPNIFLIGVQKAGTTSLNNWLSQHPQIYSYNSLKDIPLFSKYQHAGQVNKRLLLETPAYKQQPVVLHAAVNYIFYPSLIKSIAQAQPNAKLIVVLRNPVTRAISSYFYFRKMLREKRDIETALLYQPKEEFEVTPDNNDFTYIEHGFYYQQIKNCLEYFSLKQLLVLDYEELKHNPQNLLKEIFQFLNIDDSFLPNLQPKNITGQLKSKLLQQKLLKKNSSRKWIIDNLINPWLPVNKRKLLKNKMLELNTIKQKHAAANFEVNEEALQKIKFELTKFYTPDAALLDELLHTDFRSKWFGHEAAKN